MASTEGKPQFDPEEDLFDRSIIEAQYLLSRGEGDDFRITEDQKEVCQWFLEHKDSVQDVAEEIGVSDRLGLQVLMSLVLGSSIAHDKTIAQQPKKISAKLEQLKKHLAKAENCLRELQLSSRPKQLKVVAVSVEDQPDGSVILELGPDPYVELAAAITHFNELAKGIALNLGRRRTILSIAVARIEEFVRLRRPQIGVSEIEDIVSRLLDPVRYRDRQLNRSPDALPGEVSGYKHLRSRKKESRRESGSRAGGSGWLPAIG